MARKPKLSQIQIDALNAIKDRVSYSITINTDGLHETMISSATSALKTLGYQSAESNIGTVVNSEEFPTGYDTE